MMTTHAKSVVMSKLLRARVIKTPKPTSPPSHSAMTAPEKAYVTEILQASKKVLAHHGTFTQKKVIIHEAPHDSAISRVSFGAVEKPPTQATATGKKVISATKTTFGKIPKPRMRTIKGAIAMTGIVCETFSRGNSALFAILNLSRTIATIKPAPTPKINPRIDS